MNNLATQQPERVKTLAAAWDAWAERCKVNKRPRDPGEKTKESEKSE
jgi:hypothetical protein